LVPAGGFDQDRAGERFSPTQFGFCLLLPAILVGSRSPSLNDDDVIVKAPCAKAFWLLEVKATAIAPARTRVRITNMTSPPVDRFGHGRRVYTPREHQSNHVTPTMKMELRLPFVRSSTEWCSDRRITGQCGCRIGG
jgi:hypothetical protein